jgi:hypothetical protein
LIEKNSDVHHLAVQDFSSDPSVEIESINVKIGTNVWWTNFDEINAVPVVTVRHLSLVKS